MHRHVLHIRERVLGAWRIPTWPPAWATSVRSNCDWGNISRPPILFHAPSSSPKKIWVLNHPAQAMRLSNLAIAYRNLGRYNKADHAAAQALLIREAKLKAGHCELGLSWLSPRQYPHRSAALTPKPPQSLDKSLQIFRTSFGEEHEYTAVTLSTYGELHVKQHRP